VHRFRLIECDWLQVALEFRTGVLRNRERTLSLHGRKTWHPCAPECTPAKSACMQPWPFHRWQASRRARRARKRSFPCGMLHNSVISHYGSWGSRGGCSNQQKRGPERVVKRRCAQARRRGVLFDGYGVQTSMAVNACTYVGGGLQPGDQPTIRKQGWWKHDARW
jgi:hypothetical protein